MKSEIVMEVEYFPSEDEPFMNSRQKEYSAHVKYVFCYNSTKNIRILMKFGPCFF